MTNREKTSPRVARIAAKWMGANVERLMWPHLVRVHFDDAYFTVFAVKDWRDIRAMAASCLTQTAAKPTPKRKPSRPVKRSNYITGSGQKFGRSP